MSITNTKTLKKQPLGTAMELQRQRPRSQRRHSQRRAARSREFVRERSTRSAVLYGRTAVGKVLKDTEDSRLSLGQKEREKVKEDIWKITRKKRVEPRGIPL